MKKTITIKDVKKAFKALNEITPEVKLLYKNKYYTLKELKKELNAKK